MRTLLSLVFTSLAACASSSVAESPYQERQCVSNGWQAATVDVAGLDRRLLWKAPEGPWARGAIIVLHGGGGHHYQFCTANARIVAPQVRFTELALAQGFAVFLLESSDQVTDNDGRLCGKAWDDEVRDRPNLDLPFIEIVLRETIPSSRPDGSQNAVFMTGLSSGGYMTVRAATHVGDLITAFAPVSSGDPYGWHRICDASLTLRRAVHGAGFDNETGKRINEPGACRSETYPNEKPWNDSDTGNKPVFRMFQHRYDGMNDFSCSEKIAAQLEKHGYPSAPAFLLEGNERRSLKNHLWQDEYSQALLTFFAAQLGEGRPDDAVSY